MTNFTDIADRFTAAKAAADAANAVLAEIKSEIDALGVDRIEGTNTVLSIHLSVRRALSEIALIEKLGVTKEQVESCKVEGNPFPVIKIKAKIPA